MAFHLTLILLVFLMVPASLTAQSAGKLTKIDALWRLAMEKNRVKHAALVVAYRGKVIHTIELGRKATERAAVASVSKAVTASCVARLVDQGKLKTDTTLGEVFGSWLEGLGLDNPANATITIEQLLTHSSGLKPDRTQKGGVQAWYGQGKNRDADIAARALKNRRGGKPGSYFYNNENYAILGMVVNARTGLAQDRACAALALAPAGISGATFDRHWSVFGSAGGWSLSAMDLSRFASRSITRTAAHGRPVTAWPSVRRDARLLYGVGEIYKVSSRGGVAFHYHFGHLRNGKGRNDGAFFLVLGNGWTLSATTDTLTESALEAAVGQMLNAASGPG